MTCVTVSSKGQVVIPAEARRLLGIAPGSQVDVSVVDGKIEIALTHPAGKSSHDAGFGMLKYSGAPRRLADFDAAAAMLAEKTPAKARPGRVR
jgi:antitoxin PrlF